MPPRRHRPRAPHPRPRRRRRRPPLRPAARGAPRLRVARSRPWRRARHRARRRASGGRRRRRGGRAPRSPSARRAGCATSRRPAARPSRRPRSPARSERAPQRLDRHGELRADHVLELAAGEAHLRSAGSGSSTGIDVSVSDDSASLAVDALLAQARRPRPSRSGRPRRARRARRRASAARARTPRRRSRCRRGARCPRACRASPNPSAVLRSTAASNVPPPRSYTGDDVAGLDPLRRRVVDRGRLGLGEHDRVAEVGLADGVVEQLALVGTPVRRVGDRDAVGRAAFTRLDLADGPLEQLGS